jgi:hypothetical protein
MYDDRPPMNVYAKGTSVWIQLPSERDGPLDTPVLNIAKVYTEWNQCDGRYCFVDFYFAPYRSKIMRCKNDVVDKIVEAILYWGSPNAFPFIENSCPVDFRVPITSRGQILII